MSRPVQLLTGVLAALLLAPGGALAAGEKVVANPGNFTADLTSGTVKIGALPEFSLERPTQLRGTIDANGNIDHGTINFAPVDVHPPSFQAGQDVTIRLQALNTITGQLDPKTGQAALRIKLRAKLVHAVLGGNCYVGSAGSPIDFNTLSTQGGTAYNAGQGTIALINNRFSVPRATNCSGVAGDQTQAVNQTLGLPSSNGRNNVRLAFKFQPAPQSGGAAIVGGVRQEEQGAGKAPEDPIEDAEEVPLLPGAKKPKNSSKDPLPAALLGGGGGGGTSAPPTAPSFGSSPTAGSARVYYTPLFYDEGRTSLYLGCRGELGSTCSGTVTLRRTNGLTVGRRHYRLDAGDSTATYITVRLSRRTVRRGKPLRLRVQLKPTGDRMMQRTLRLQF